jgi:hypothetical protein
VEAYKDEHEPIPDAETDLLGELMQSNQISQTRLAKGSAFAKSTFSAVLNRENQGRKIKVDIVLFGRRQGCGPFPLRT